MKRSVFKLHPAGITGFSFVAGTRKGYVCLEWLNLLFRNIPQDQLTPFLSFDFRQQCFDRVKQAKPLYIVISLEPYPGATGYRVASHPFDCGHRDSRLMFSDDIGRTQRSLTVDTSRLVKLKLRKDLGLNLSGPALRNNHKQVYISGSFTPPVKARAVVKKKFTVKLYRTDDSFFHLDRPDWPSLCSSGLRHWVFGHDVADQYEVQLTLSDKPLDSIRARKHRILLPTPKLTNREGCTLLADQDSNRAGRSVNLLSEWDRYLPAKLKKEFGLKFYKQAQSEAGAEIWVVGKTR